MSVRAVLSLSMLLKPHGGRVSPESSKGVFIDTNRGCGETFLRSMTETRRIGGREGAARDLRPGDIVFCSLGNLGLVAAARVIGPDVGENADVLYWNVEFLTPVPKDFGMMRVMPFGEVTRVTGRTFDWVRIPEVPSLSSDEAGALLNELRVALGGE